MCRNKKPYDDDGRSFADMDVDGMPWFARLGAKPERSGSETLTPSERRHALLGIFAAIAAVVLIFGAVFFIVIALMAKP